MQRLTTGADIETARDLAVMSGYRNPNEIVSHGMAAWTQYLKIAKKINDNFTSPPAAR